MSLTMYVYSESTINGGIEIIGRWCSHTRLHRELLNMWSRSESPDSGRLLLETDHLIQLLDKVINNELPYPCNTAMDSYTTNSEGEKVSPTALTIKDVEVLCGALKESRNGHCNVYYSYEW